MSILASLQARQGFTESDNKLADFVMAHPDDVSSLTVDALARESFTSAATVVRFCRKVGCDGYRDFCVRLTAEIERDRMGRRGVDTNAPFTEGEGVPSVMSSIASLHKDAVDTCHRAVSPSVIYGAARTIYRADRLFYLALGKSALLTECFAGELAKIGKLALSIERSGDWSTVASLITHDDACLVVSYSGYALRNSFMHALELKNRGCKTILITGSEGAVADAGFDHSILIPQSENGWGKVSSFYSLAALRYVLDCLYGAVYSFSYAESKSRRDELERFIWEDYARER